MIRWRRLSLVSILFVIIALFISPNHQISAASGPVVTFTTQVQNDPNKLQFTTENDSDQEATVTLMLPAQLVADATGQDRPKIAWNAQKTQATLRLAAHQTQRWVVPVISQVAGTGIVQMVDEQHHQLALQTVTVSPPQSASDLISSDSQSSSSLQSNASNSNNVDRSSVQTDATGSKTASDSSQQAGTSTSSRQPGQKQRDSAQDKVNQSSSKIAESASTVSQTESSASASEKTITSGRQAKPSPTERAGTSTTAPVIDYGDPISGNYINYTGGSLSLPVYLTAPKAGRYLVYLELWSNRYQEFAEITVTGATNRQKFTVTIPAEYMPQYSDQISGFNLYASDESNNFSDPLHYVLTLDVPDQPADGLTVTAPNAITFNPTDEPIDAEMIWNQKLPTRIIPTDSDALGANTLSVIDGREDTQPWMLTVSADQSQQLTGSDHDVLQDAMHYLHNGRDLPINNNQVLVTTQGEYPSESIHDVDYHLYTTVTNVSRNWNANTGLFLEAAIGTGGGEAYSGSLTWHVTDGVANN